MKKTAGYFIVLLVLCLLFIISILHPGEKIDEYYHHLPSLNCIYQNGVIDGIISCDYRSANTPLPYIINLLPLKIFGIEPDIAIARMVNFFISLFTLLLIIYYLNKQYSVKPDTMIDKLSSIPTENSLFAVKIANFEYFISRNFIYPLLASLIIAFYPYYIKTSVTFYQAIYGLLFFMLYLVFIEKESTGHWILSSLSLAAAVLCQQFYMVLYPYHLLKLYKSFRGEALLKETIIKAGILIISLIPVSAVFIMWGGITHPNYLRHSVSFQAVNITSMLAVAGLTFMPFVIYTFRKVSLKITTLFILTALLLTIFFTPVWQNGAGEDKISGLTFHSLEILSGFSDAAKFIVQIILIVSGQILFYVLFKNYKSIYSELIVISLFFIGFIFNVVFSERHILPMIVITYLAIFKNLNNIKLLSVWAIIQVIIGSGYFYYYIFITQSYGN